LLSRVRPCHSYAVALFFSIALFRFFYLYPEYITGDLLNFLSFNFTLPLLALSPTFAPSFFVLSPSLVRPGEIVRKLVLVVYPPSLIALCLHHLIPLGRMLPLSVDSDLVRCFCYTLYFPFRFSLSSVTPCICNLLSPCCSCLHRFRLPYSSPLPSNAVSSYSHSSIDLVVPPITLFIIPLPLLTPFAGFPTSFNFLPKILFFALFKLVYVPPLYSQTSGLDPCRFVCRLLRFPCIAVLPVPLRP